MTMYEIQDLTLSTSRGLERIDQRFQRLKREFEDDLNNGFAVAAIRASAVPVATAFVIDDLFNQVDVFPFGDVPFESNYPGSRLTYYGPNSIPEPILRGVRAHSRYPGEGFRRLEAHCDGAVNVVTAVFTTHEHSPTLLPEDVISHPAMAAYVADKLRRAAGVPDAEYALELQIVCTPKEVDVMGFGRRARMVWRRWRGSAVFPRYLLKDTTTFSAIADRIYRDFFHCLGEPDDRHFKLDVRLPGV
jgi:hypothetical protein